jgi:hypothetical protein
MINAAQILDRRSGTTSIPSEGAARAATGHAAAAPQSSAMNSRRFMSNMGLPPRVPPPIIPASDRRGRRFAARPSLPAKGPPVFGADRLANRPKALDADLW